MEAYRDQYATLFKGGKRVTLIGISVDPDTALSSWMKDANLPFIFASDGDGAVGMQYGAFMPQNKVDNRSLYVVGPDGTIAYKAQPFRQSSADAYTELEAVIDKLSPPAGGKP